MVGRLKAVFAGRSMRACAWLVGLALAIVVVQAPAAGTAKKPPLGRFFVPTGPTRTGFGHFEETRYSTRALRHALGRPSRVEPGRPYESECTLRWPRLGVVAVTTDYGQNLGPCNNGYFIAATLTDPRWHTASGVHPGSPRSAARAASRRRCRHRTYGCGATGYALELHRTDCAAGLVAGVIAHLRGPRVVSLIVGTRGCE